MLLSNINDKAVHVSKQGVKNIFGNKNKILKLNAVHTRTYIEFSHFMGTIGCNITSELAQGYRTSDTLLNISNRRPIRDDNRNFNLFRLFFNDNFFLHICNDK